MVIDNTGVSFSCHEGQSVLDAALHAGIPLRYGCGHGECGTCRAIVIAGEYELSESVSPFALLEHELDEGWTLLCSTVAYSDLVVDATVDEVDRPFITPQEFRFKVVSNTAVSPAMRVLRAVSLEGGARYYPGQYFELRLDAGGADRRAYSFASLPEIAGASSAEIEFVVRLVPGGRATSRLASCAPGEILDISSPYGNMTLRQSTTPKVLVAGGSGIGPIRSIAQEILAGPPPEAVWVFHGSQLRDELLWYDELTAADAEHAWFHYVPALSTAGEDAGWSGRVGLISDVLGEVLDAGEVARSESYVCGPGPMVRAARQVLTQMGCPDDRIFADEF